MFFESQVLGWKVEAIWIKPPGYAKHSDWKWPFIVNFPTKNHRNSGFTYGKLRERLPEGNKQSLPKDIPKSRRMQAAAAKEHDAFVQDAKNNAVALGGWKETPMQIEKDQHFM